MPIDYDCFEWERFYRLIFNLYYIKSLESSLLNEKDISHCAKIDQSCRRTLSQCEVDLIKTCTSLKEMIN